MERKHLDKNIKKIPINGELLLKEMHDHGYNRQSMGKKIGCTGRCIGVWMQRGEMPRSLYEDIMKVLRKDFLSPEKCGCDIDGDIFIYNGKEVWIDLQKYWIDGWRACKEAMIHAVGEEEKNYGICE